MIKSITKNTLLSCVFLALAACGGSDSGNDTSSGSVTPADPSPTGTSNLAIGEGHYETTCAGCHDEGLFGASPIDVNACMVADCGSVEELANYISEFMPIGDVTACSLDGENSCALTTAAYLLNGFSTEMATATSQ